MTQGKIERYHRSLKNVVKLERYYTPREVERAVGGFAEDCNHRRYHEVLQNVTPAICSSGDRPPSWLVALGSNNARCNDRNVRTYRRRITRPFAQKCL